MLNGIDPIILVTFSKLLPSELATISKIPLVSTLVDKLDLLPIPIYLSETLTGLYIVQEDKNIDVETSTETLPDGADPVINQKGINSTVKVQLQAHKDSLGLTLLSALMDIAFEKVTSREYSITYLHGPITVFAGLLNSFSIAQNSDDELLSITLELTRTSVSTKGVFKVPKLGSVTGSIPL